MLSDPLWLTALGVEDMSLEGSGIWWLGGPVNLCVDFIENRELPLLHVGVGEKALLASRNEVAAKLLARLWWSPHKNRCTGL